jgi:hypothetical protein
MKGRAAAKPAAMLFAALLALFSVAAGEATPLRGPALGFGMEVGAALARSPYWPLKDQAWLSTRLMLEIQLAGILGLGFSLGYHVADDSDPAAGYLYRGHNGMEVSTYLLLRPVLAAEQPRARVGCILGGSANFDMYNHTELLFFYPSLMAEPYIELPTEVPPRITFCIGLPFRLDFRRDMDLSSSVGLGLRWRWYPKWRRGVA